MCGRQRRAGTLARMATVSGSARRRNHWGWGYEDEVPSPDELRAAGRLVFGPGADGARLEGSKAWMKEVLAILPSVVLGAKDKDGRDIVDYFLI